MHYKLDACQSLSNVIAHRTALEFILAGDGRGSRRAKLLDACGQRGACTMRRAGPSVQRGLAGGRPFQQGPESLTSRPKCHHCRLSERIRAGSHISARVPLRSFCALANIAVSTSSNTSRWTVALRLHFSFPNDPDEPLKSE